MGLIRELNEAARLAHKLEHKALARSLAAKLDAEITWLHTSAGNRDAMRELVGTWTRAIKLLEIIQQPAPPQPRTDAVDVERKAA